MNIYRKFTIVLRYTAFFACALLFLMGCGRLSGNAAKISAPVWEDIEYIHIDTSTIENKELLAWIDEHSREQGVHVFDEKTILGKYILIAAGEKPTGGYSLHIDKVKGSADEIEIAMSVMEPGKGEFVTQGFAYPYLVIQINTEGRKIVLEK